MNEKEQGEGLSSLSACSLCEKNCLIFQTAEFILISSVAVAKSFSVLSLVQHIKVFFIKKV